MELAEKYKFLTDLFRNAVASENPVQQIVTEMEKIKDSDPELWTMIEETKEKMLQSMNSLSMDEKKDMIKDWQDINGKKDFRKC